jgi:GntR family transcriptional regulator
MAKSVDKLYSAEMSIKKTPKPIIKKFFNPFPKYLQLREILRKRMQSEFDVGDRLPTEETLCKEFGVSRETVREALRSFKQEGLIEQHRAQGTFLVRRPEEIAEQRLTGMSEDFTALKLDTHAKVLSSTVVRASAAARQIQTNTEEVFRIVRLRYFDNRPLALHVAYLPIEIGRRVSLVDLRHTSIVQVIEETLRIPCFEERQQVEAMVADSEMAQQLEIPIGAPVLFLTRFFRMLDDTPLVLFHSYYRADRYHYTLNIAEGHKTKVSRSKSGIGDANDRSSKGRRAKRE